LGEICADLIRFVENKKIVHPQKFNLLRLCQSVFYSSSVQLEQQAEHEHRK